MKFPEELHSSCLADGGSRRQFAQGLIAESAWQIEKFEDSLLKGKLLNKQPLLRRSTQRHSGFKQPREQRRHRGSLAIIRRPVPIIGKATGVIKSVIERFGNSPEIAPAYQLGQPAEFVLSCTEFVGPHEASLFDSTPPYKTSQRHCLWALDILEHPIQGLALDRGRDFYFIVSAHPLKVAVNGRGVWFLVRGLQKHFEKLWRGSVVMLSVTEKLP